MPVRVATTRRLANGRRVRIRRRRLGLNKAQTGGPGFYNLTLTPKAPALATAATED
jgi:hypothetical protein